MQNCYEMFYGCKKLTKIQMSCNFKNIDKIGMDSIFDGIPEEVMELKKGQKVQIRGTVNSIEPSRVHLRVNVNKSKLEEVN